MYVCMNTSQSWPPTPHNTVSCIQSILTIAAAVPAPRGTSHTASRKDAAFHAPHVSHIEELSVDGLHLSDLCKCQPLAPLDTGSSRSVVHSALSVISSACIRLLFKLPPPPSEGDPRPETRVWVSVQTAD